MIELKSTEGSDVPVLSTDVSREVSDHSKRLNLQNGGTPYLECASCCAWIECRGNSGMWCPSLLESPPTESAGKGDECRDRAQ